MLLISSYPYLKRLSSRGDQQLSVRFEAKDSKFDVLAAC